MARFFTVFVVILALAITGTPAFANAKNAESFITTIGEDVLKIAANKGESDSAKEQKLTELFRKNIDFQWISDFVLGKHKRAASPEQLARYNKAN